MRIAAVRADGADRRMIAHQAMLGEMIEDALLHFRLAHRAVPADPLGDEGKGYVERRARVLSRFLMHGPLFVIPARLEHLHEVAGRNHVDTAGTDQLDRAGIDPRNVRVGVAGHIFHGHPACAADQRRDASFQLLPAQIRPCRAGQMIQRMRLDAMLQLAGFTVCGNEIEPAAGQHRFARQADHAAGQHIEPAEIVKEPAIKTQLPDGRLNRCEVEHGNAP